MIYIQRNYIEFKDTKNYTHRPKGPAWIETNLSEYMIHGKSHRLDGPALIVGKKEKYYINNHLLTEKEYFEELKRLKKWSNENDQYKQNHV